MFCLLLDKVVVTVAEWTLSEEVAFVSARVCVRVCVSVSQAGTGYRIM